MIAFIVLRTPENRAPVSSVTLLEAAYVGCMCMCHLHFGQNDRDLVRASALTRGGTVTEIRVSTES